MGSHDRIGAWNQASLVANVGEFKFILYVTSVPIGKRFDMIYKSQIGFHGFNYQLAFRSRTGHW